MKLSLASLPVFIYGKAGPTRSAEFVRLSCLLFELFMKPHMHPAGEDLDPLYAGSIVAILLSFLVYSAGRLGATYTC